MKKASALIAVAGLAGTAAATGLEVGDFSWTLNNADGGTGSVDNGNNSLSVTGPDNSFAGETTLTTTAPTDGTISADYLYTSIDSPGFDFGFYEVNGANTNFASASGDAGSITFAVSAGDSFGFGVETVDGIFGPGVVNISNFRFIPAPSSLALLGLGGLVASRRRR